MKEPKKTTHVEGGKKSRQKSQLHPSQLLTILRIAMAAFMIFLPVLLLAFSGQVISDGQDMPPAQTTEARDAQRNDTDENILSEAQNVPQPLEPLEPLKPAAQSDALDFEQAWQPHEASVGRLLELLPEVPLRESPQTVPDPPDEPPEPPAAPDPPEPSRTAYLTFDDGPSRNITPGILDVLQQEGVLATFFVLPHPPRNVDDIYWRIIEEGHEVGNHSYTHNYSNLYRKGIEAFREDIVRASEYILGKFDYKMTSFRFPGGPMGRPASVISERRKALDELGYRDFSWDIDSGDANPYAADRSADGITKHVLGSTRDKEHLVILFHDTRDKETTLEALPVIIEGLREQDYGFDILRNYPQD